MIYQEITDHDEAVVAFMQGHEVQRLMNVTDWELVNSVAEIRPPYRYRIVRDMTPKLVSHEDKGLILIILSVIAVIAVGILGWVAAALFAIVITAFIMKA